jgi:hypothetical protein
MALFTTAGSRFYIGPARPGWQAISDYGDASTSPAGDAWVEVASVSGLGRISGEWEVKTWNIVESIHSQQEKDTAPILKMGVVVGLEDDDPGQLALFAAEKSLDPFWFRLDLPSGARRTFTALVVGLEEVFDDGNAVVGVEFT